jgi:hypothetical protein
MQACARRRATGCRKYIVGVGSRHISGKRYRWSPGCGPGEVKLAPLPQWIADLAVEIKKPNGDWKRTPRTPDYYRELVAPAMNGERHVHVARLLGHLFGAAYPNRGILLRLVLSHVRQTYPDLTDFDDDEIIKIAEDLARRNDQKRGT